MISELEEMRLKMENGSIIGTAGTLQIPNSFDHDEETIRRRKSTTFSVE